MKNNSQSVPAAGANRADAVAQMGSVMAARAAGRAMVDGEDHRVALVDASTSMRDCRRGCCLAHSPDVGNGIQLSRAQDCSICLK